MAADKNQLLTGEIKLFYNTLQKQQYNQYSGVGHTATNLYINPIILSNYNI